MVELTKLFPERTEYTVLVHIHLVFEYICVSVLILRIAILIDCDMNFYI